MRAITAKVAIQHKEKFYKFVTISLGEDGSFYIFFEKKEHCPNKIKNGTRKISYHCTGQVHCTNVDSKRIFLEPLINLTEPNLFGSYIIPSIDFLEILPYPPNEKDFILVIEDNKPYQFNFFLSPWNTVYPVALHYQKLFSLIIEFTPPKNCYLQAAKDVFFIPEEGKYENRQIDLDKAYTVFHQRVNGENFSANVLDFPNNEGVRKIVCSRPMVSVPMLTVKFKDQSLYFEQLKEQDKNKEKYIVRFKVKGKSGYIKGPIEITSFILDARLGIY